MLKVSTIFNLTHTCLLKTSTMTAIKKIALLSVLILSIWSCSKDQPLPLETGDEHVLIYQELLRMEYAILTDDHAKLIEHSNNLDMLLKNNYNLFCPEESSQIDGARMTNKILAQHTQTEKKHILLDDLRILKGTIVHLVSDEDYDPYFAFLWRFEEDMYLSTMIAMDPMLDLYEWNEFQAAVECMNDSWRPVQLHFPSAEMLDNNPLKYKNQSVFKIYLEKALDEFNLAVSTADYEKYPLCESAEEVQKAYIAYIKTFTEGNIDSDSFIAKL